MKTKHILLIIIIATGLGVIISTFVSTNTYADFGQATENTEKQYHIIGKLDTTKPISYNTSIDANRFSFYMIDNKGITKMVVCNINKPQDFEKSDMVVVVGKMQSDTFVADNLLLKCPSKYNSQNKPESFGNKEFHGKNK